MAGDYEVALFRASGFSRLQCPTCSSWHWSLGDHGTCGETPCKEYDFLGASPMKKSLSLRAMREDFLTFFEDRGHTRVRRYPIVARWRDDVFYTQASVYPFQPFVIEGVAEPPANPLAISQPCARFNDIDNVGKTGQHMTMFEMLAHHAFNRPGKEVYWKDRTVELCHAFFTERLGVDPALLQYKESWWTGGGNSGPCFEVILGGAEVATLVFMSSREEEGRRVPMETRVVDTGYGLERLTWVSQGATSAYEAVFGDMLQYLKRATGATRIEDRVLREYSRVAGASNVESFADVRAIRERTAERLGMAVEDLLAAVSPLEHIYAALDHARALMFVLADGVVPSNGREGYYARLLVRRGMRALRALELDMRLSDLVVLFVQHYMEDFPEVFANRTDVLRLLDVEQRRFDETLSKGREVVRRLEADLRAQGASEVPAERLVELYDSHGLTPEIAREFAELPVRVPDDFYARVAARHETVAREARASVWPGAPPRSALRVYEDPDRREFRTAVLAVKGKAVVLGETYFYPEGGGQEADRGTIGGYDVLDVQAVGDSVVHLLKVTPDLKPGAEVSCSIDWDRRRRLRRHHTATHITLGAARKVLGNHVWQAGAHKAEDVARLDITHYDALTEEEVRRIEALANEVVLSDRPVHTSFVPRDQAERRYGFRLYQGGSVPGGSVRVVEVPDWDVEACGGTHAPRTGELAFIRILRASRIQDGVVRLEYVAGSAAVERARREADILQGVRGHLGVPEDQIVPAVERLLEEAKDLRKRVASMERDAVASAIATGRPGDVVEVALGGATARLATESVGGVRLLSGVVENATGGDLTRLAIPLLGTPGVVVAVVGKGPTAQVVVARSEDVELDCLVPVREASALLGGGGGGRPDFAQGGGAAVDRAQEALDAALRAIRAGLGV